MAQPVRTVAAKARRFGTTRIAAIGGVALVIAATIASCSTEGVLRPDVDIGMQTAAVPPRIVPPAPTLAPVEPTPAPVMPDLAPLEPTFGTTDDMALPAESDEPDEPVIQIAPATTPAQVAAVIPPGSVKPKGLQTLVPSNPMMVAYPRMDSPMAPSTAMPADEVACRNDLKRLGVTFRNLAPINDGGACRIDYPVSVSAIGGVKMKPAATLSCSMAATFSRWTRKELVPAARWRYWSSVKTIHQGSSYSCRRIARTTTPSEHSKGNALDVMRIELTNGKDIDVRKPGWFAFREKGFLNTVRADGCDYFTTVLGPGYNYDHRNHFHFDIKPRKNGYVACR
ncbi:extensin family protein [Pseudaminobacter salicylatoxidans]|uniref:extensin-like domain-containing protein n=1 Tax=Pseudaminobacter salicylatoxidans TaxID=93369 RepID=UPI00030346C7